MTLYETIIVILVLFESPRKKNPFGMSDFEVRNVYLADAMLVQGKRTLATKLRHFIHVPMVMLGKLSRKLKTLRTNLENSFYNHVGLLSSLSLC